MSRGTSTYGTSPSQSRVMPAHTRMPRTALAVQVRRCLPRHRHLLSATSNCSPPRPWSHSLLSSLLRASSSCRPFAAPLNPFPYFPSKLISALLEVAQASACHSASQTPTSPLVHGCSVPVLFPSRLSLPSATTLTNSSAPELLLPIPGSTRPGAENRMTSQWSLLPPHKLLPFVVPFKGSGGSLGGGGVNNPLTPTAVSTFLNAQKPRHHDKIFEENAEEGRMKGEESGHGVKQPNGTAWSRSKRRDVDNDAWRPKAQGTLFCFRRNALKSLDDDIESLGSAVSGVCRFVAGQPLPAPSSVRVGAWAKGARGRRAAGGGEIGIPPLSPPALPPPLCCSRVQSVPPRRRFWRSRARGSCRPSFKPTSRHVCPPGFPLWTARKAV